MHSSDHISSAARPLRRKNTLRLAGLALVAGSSAMLAFSPSANAADITTVNLGTAANYSVLGASTVTNTNFSVLDGSVGLSPGPEIVGFPPGIVNAPATIEQTTIPAASGQADLGTAYTDAATRVVNFTRPLPDLVGLTLEPGVYESTAHGPLTLSGRLVLDGQGLTDPVFIFQTDSTLITSSGSSIQLINGATECDVFWQVGSSATLGSGSSFVGNILAHTSVTVENSVTVRGRAFADTGAVTLDNDRFFQPSCEPTDGLGGTTTTTSTTVAPTPSSDAAPPSSDVGGTPTSSPDQTIPPTDGGTTIPGTPGGGFGPTDTTPVTGFGTGTSMPAFDDTDITLPVTGTATKGTAPLAAGALLIGVAALVIARRRTAA